MTEREAFEKSKAHLLRQMQVARDNSGKCRFRTDEGLKCAIGCLIPDAEYDPKMDSDGGNFVTHGDFEKTPPSLKGLSKEFLRGLQDVHDNCDTCEWATKLNEFEEEYFSD